MSAAEDTSGTSTAAEDRSESDRLQEETWFQRTIRRPEIGAFVVMMIVIFALAFASDGKAFNALGLKNNIKR